MQKYNFTDKSGFHSSYYKKLLLDAKFRGVFVLVKSQFLSFWSTGGWNYPDQNCFLEPHVICISRTMKSWIRHIRKRYLRV